MKHSDDTPALKNLCAVLSSLLRYLGCIPQSFSLRESSGPIIRNPEAIKRKLQF